MPVSSIEDVQIAYLQRSNSVSGSKPKTLLRTRPRSRALSVQYSAKTAMLGSTTSLASIFGGGATSPITGEDVVADAKKYLGIPYVWGGTNPAKGLDCSGLVQLVYKDMGISLPRTAAQQATQGDKVASLAQAKPGDLVAFGTPVDHIGIYAGNNKMIVAPKRGDVVKVQDIYETPVAIRRILPENTGTSSASQLSFEQAFKPGFDAWRRAQRQATSAIFPANTTHSSPLPARSTASRRRC